MDLDSIVGICIAGCGGWLYTQGAQAPPSVVPDPAPEADLRPVDSSQLVGVSTSSRLTLVELPQPFVVALLQASTPDLLGDLFPSFLARYVDHPSLTGDDYWPLRARLTRPLRAGVSARRVLAGAFDKQVRSIPVNQDNIIYVVLPCSRSSDGPGFVTRHYSVFAAPWWATGNWFSVSRIYASWIEAEVFLRGAHVQFRALMKLRSLAGPPPPRVSWLGASSKAAARAPTFSRNLFAEAEAEAIAGNELEQLASGSQDPLVQSLVPNKSSDPITNHLGSESGSSSANGVKGCNGSG